MEYLLRCECFFFVCCMGYIRLITEMHIYKYQPSMAIYGFIRLYQFDLNYL